MITSSGMNMMKRPLPALMALIAAAMVILPVSAFDVSGNSDDLVLFSISEAGLYTLTMHYTGSSPFVVTLEDDQRIPLGYLALEPGSFQGQVKVDLDPGDYFLRITASGPWSIDVAAPAPVTAITTPPTPYMTTTIPTLTPTPPPTACPNGVCPGSLPTTEPTSMSTVTPTTLPNCWPNCQPTTLPTSIPTTMPVTTPSTIPTTSPTTEPTTVPTTGPTMEPMLPHLFYGTLTFLGEPAAPGTVIMATVGGGGGSLTTATAGYYGNVSPLGDKLIVQGSISNGAAISFSVNGHQAECNDVNGGGSWQPTYPFTSGALTELNLRVTEPGEFYVINATAGNGGTIVPGGLVSVTAGANMTFTITPFSGYAIHTVVVDSVSKGVIPTYTFTEVSANHTISASFRQTSSSGGGGGGGGGGNSGTPTPTVTTTATITQAGTTIFVSSGGSGSGANLTPNVTPTLTVTPLDTTPIPPVTPIPGQSFWDRYPQAWMIALALVILGLAAYGYYSYRKEQAGTPPEAK